MPTAWSETAIGVKKGDWIEYTVTTTGVPVNGHDIKYARMEIVDIQGNGFLANVVSQHQNGSWSSGFRSFNLEEGQVQAWVVIPPNLGAGDSFYDAFLGQHVIIDGEEEKTVAGATRTTTYVDTPERHKRWDKATGVFVETYDVLENYTVNATATATNMWGPQATAADQSLFLVVVAVLSIAIVVLVAGLVAVLVPRKKK
jgi:hypothetical protein